MLQRMLINVSWFFVSFIKKFIELIGINVLAVEYYQYIFFIISKFFKKDKIKLSNYSHVKFQ